MPPLPPLTRPFFLSATLICLLAACVSPSVNPDSQNGQALGQIGAAVSLAQTCDGITSLAPADAAALIAQEDGLNTQSLLSPVFYGDRAALQAAGDAALQARGVDPSNSGQACAFARGVAGTNDPIGRLLRT